MKFSLNILYLILILFLSTHSRAQEARPKIGLVLSGGGARGLAHVGTLKLIDSLQIPIDYIAGTSMGGIVGALYASGYTGNEIEKAILATDWTEMLRDKPPRSEMPYLEKKDDGKFQIELGLDGFTPVLPSGFISGQNISLRFADLTSAVGSIHDFDKLPIPFRCVAIDLLTGNEVVLKKGSLHKAMRATMSIPTIFSPVEWGDSLLIDGGFLNNFPADILKEMGADIIIGVNVGSQLLPKEELTSLLDVLAQTIVLTDYAKQKENFELCEILIQPNLNNYSITDFEKDRVKEIVQIGIDAAAENKNLFIELKKKYVLGSHQFLENDPFNPKPQIISSIILSGGSSYTLQYLYELTGIKPNDTLDVIKLHDKISKMKTSGLFLDVQYDIEPVDKGLINLSFKLTEKKQPVIHGFTIVGNENLHFDFIMNLLGLHPGDPFDKAKLNEQIKYMFGLGYFEEITYLIKPVRDNYIHLVINVKEKPLRKLRLGFRYDDNYKIVGILGLQTTNLPFVGFRGELFLQFAGLFKFEYSALYPSRTLNFPLYPYIRMAYKDVPVDIFDITSADRIAEYNDRSWTFGAGFGHIIKNTGVVRLEYHHEYIDINPNITGLDPVYFQSWKDKLRIIHADISIDRLDDPITPRHGFMINALYDLSLKRLGSKLEYRYYQLDAKFFTTVADKHTFGFTGFYTDAFDDFPLYKWLFRGGADTFVGMKINQIEGYNFGYLRFDYRYEFKKDIFFKLIANAGNYNMAKPDIHSLVFNRTFYGFGFGVKLLSIVGPFQLIFSRGSKSVYNWRKFKTQIYFTAGFLF
ncbi:MAG: BamA/TamA family outer membrane protein [Calditrichaeota bacterium]|nr:BamA/TamA family outer membrane protein [Calditrichota bacterium]